MATIVVRRYSPSGLDTVSETRMYIVTEDGAVRVDVPFAPSNISYGGRAQSSTSIDRPGRLPILAMGGPQLSTMSFDLILVDPDPDVDVENLIEGLESLAASGQRMVVNFGPAEAGLWRMTDFSYSSVTRHPVTSAITAATASLAFTQASDSAARVGPVSGGATAPAAPAKTRIHVVTKGQTLGIIARKYYGDVRRWRFIADANKIRNPKQTAKLQPGRKLKIPPLKKA